MTFHELLLIFLILAVVGSIGGYTPIVQPGAFRTYGAPGLGIIGALILAILLLKVV